MAAATPERVAPGVYRVDAVGFKNAINVLLLENDDGWTLVDTGVKSSVGRIKDALAALGSGPEDLKQVFITHQHDDHVGGLKGILEWAPRAEVGASAHEAEVVSGRRGLDPPSSRFLRYMTRNAEPPGVPVGKVLGEGDSVSGFRVIPTPGHTLGHVSLLRDSDGLLFTADAFARLPIGGAGGRGQSVLHRPRDGETLGREAALRRLHNGRRGSRPGASGGRPGKIAAGGRALPVLAGTDETPGGAWMDPFGISFRKLRPSDLDLMHRWLNTPHVRRWWYAEGTSYREIEAEYLPSSRAGMRQVDGIG